MTSPIVHFDIAGPGHYQLDEFYERCLGWSDSIRHRSDQIARDGDSFGVHRALVTRTGHQVTRCQVSHVVADRQHAPGQAIAE